MSQDTHDPASGAEESGAAAASEIAAGATPSAALTAEQIVELQTRAGEAEERFLRLYADFENFKKRAARERDETRRTTAEGLISRLIPVLDNFDMAMLAAQQPGTTVEILKAGVQMIQGQLRGVFTDLGLEELVTEGKDFDPALHDAVSQSETTRVPEGRIVQQLRKGYRLKDRLLRPASVVVAKAPALVGADDADASISNQS